MGQDSVDRMDNMFLRDMFTYIANTYGTSFAQTHIIRQLHLRRTIVENILVLPQVQINLFLCKTKPIFEKVKWI